MPGLAGTAGASDLVWASRTLGQTVRAWRLHHGWTLTELARRVGKDKGHIGKIERDEIRNVSDQLLLDLAKALRCRASQLASRTLPSDEQAYIDRLIADLPTQTTDIAAYLKARLDQTDWDDAEIDYVKDDLTNDLDAAIRQASRTILALRRQEQSRQAGTA